MSSIPSATTLPSAIHPPIATRIPHEAEESRPLSAHLTPTPQYPAKTLGCVVPTAGRREDRVTKVFHSMSPMARPSSSSSMVREFDRRLRAQEATTVFQKPPLGSSGFTFLCSTADQDFILKWVYHAQALNEKFCSEIVGRLGFRSPEIEILNDQVKETMDCHIRAKTPAYSSAPLYSVIYMPRFRTDTLCSAIEKDLFATLSPTQITHFLQEIGQIVITDLFYANNDRVIPFNPIFPNGYPETEIPPMNDGNLMIQPSRDTVKVYFIDNGSYLVKPPRSPEEESLPLGLFDEDEEESYSSPQEEPIEEATDTRTEVEKWSDLFIKFRNDPDHLAQIALGQISKKIDKIPLNRRDSISFIKEGIEIGLKKLAELQIPDYSNHPHFEVLAPVVELMERNQKQLG